MRVEQSRNSLFLFRIFFKGCAKGKPQWKIFAILPPSVNGGGRRGESVCFPFEKVRTKNIISTTSKILFTIFCLHLDFLQLRKVFFLFFSAEAGIVMFPPPFRLRQTVGG